MVHKPFGRMDTGKLDEWYNQNMLIHLTNKATKAQIMQAAEDLDGYIKFVVNIETGDVILGGSRHFEGEQFLLKRGSKQHSLWGGGYDLESKMIDYDSIINIRPHDGNPSKEVLSPEIRNTILTILIEKTGWTI